MELKIRFLSANDVKMALPMEDAIQAVKEAFFQLSLGGARVPMRTVMNIPEREAVTLIMPAYLPIEDGISLKLISLFNKNPEKGLPLAFSLVILADGKTGAPLGVLEGGTLTALRTGAASGVATSYLAREDSRTVAIFGAGVQGRTQLEAVCAVRDIERAFIFDPDEEKAKTFAGEMEGKLNIEVIVPASRKVLREADIICTATTSKNPVFSHDEIKKGVHINAVGAYKPDGREIPAETVAASKIVVDHMESCLTEAGDLIIPLKEGKIKREDIYGEIGEIIAGKKQGRNGTEEITLFKSVGNAVQDLVSAKIALKNSESKNLGREIPLI